jgi:hypothetical protein
VNWIGSGETVLVTPVVAEPELESRTAHAAGNAEGDWLCAWCHSRVANESDRLDVGGQNEFTFNNPEGVRFEIITFSQTYGCRQSGLPTLEYTWFPGYAWSYCQCAECGQHLGWYYRGPKEFVGMIKGRIVRALYLRN